MPLNVFYSTASNPHSFPSHLCITNLWRCQSPNYPLESNILGWFGRECPSICAKFRDLLHCVDHLLHCMCLHIPPQSAHFHRLDSFKTLCCLRRSPFPSYIQDTTHPKSQLVAIYINSSRIGPTFKE